MPQFTPPQYLTPEEVGVSNERLGRLDTFLQGYVDKAIIPNTVTFIARKRKIVHHKTFRLKAKKYLETYFMDVFFTLRRIINR